jgi:hypothetical protein
MLYVPFGTPRRGICSLAVSAVLHLRNRRTTLSVQWNVVVATSGAYNSPRWK